MRLDPGKFLSDNLPTAELDIPELGGSVLVRALNGADQDEYELKLATGQFRNSGYRAYLAYHCVVNDDGTLFFAQARDGKPVPPDEVMEQLARNNPWGILDRIANKVSALSAIEGVEPADVVGAKKKSASEQPADSSE